jgi:hypothetical protein
VSALLARGRLLGCIEPLKRQTFRTHNISFSVVVVFLRSLTPLRIAYRPGVILEVVMAIDDQHDSSPASSSSNGNNHLGGTGDRRSVDRDSVTLRITDNDDHQALALHSHSPPSENRVNPPFLQPTLQNHPVPAGQLISRTLYLERNTLHRWGS